MTLARHQQKHHDAFIAATKGMSSHVVAKCVTIQTHGTNWQGVTRTDLADYYANAKRPLKGRPAVFPQLANVDLVKLRQDFAEKEGIPYVPVKTPGEVYFDSWHYQQAWASLSPAEKRHYEKAAQESAARERAGKEPLNFMAPEDMDSNTEPRTAKQDSKPAAKEQPFPEAAKRVALHQSKAAGEPEKDSEPTSVGRTYYEDRAAEVLRGLAELGYRVTRPTAKRKAPAAAGR